MKISVIGAGKMGLPLACVFASHGGKVIACDVNAKVVELINQGICPFNEPEVPELLSQLVREKKLSATLDTASAVAESDVIVVIVPVMLTSQREADLSIIDSIAELIGKNLRRGSMVCFETTLPVGGTRRLGNIIERGGMRPGVDFDLVFSPERVKSQLVLKHLMLHPKVVGGITSQAAKRAEDFYSMYLGAPIINVDTLEGAELVKLAGMIYRDVNIALANELAAYAEGVGVNFEKVRQASNTDGEANILTPGIGVGGHCTPVYPYFLINEARQRGAVVELAETGRRINEAQPARMLDKLSDLAEKTVLILGLGFRPQVKETAYSPAFTLNKELKKRGARIRLHDPLYSDDEIRHYGFEPGDLPDNELLILNTAHKIYEELDWAYLAKSGVKTVLDGRNFFDGEAVKRVGIVYLGIG
jgi:nucleotide sugar dehydrogenase